MLALDESLKSGLLKRSHNPRFSFEVDTKLFYPDDTGFANFYGSRKTDGGRPSIYTNYVSRVTSNVDVLISVGCGDSAIEQSILAKVGSSNALYKAVDCSASMLDATKERMHSAGNRVELLHCDFMDDLHQMTELWQASHSSSNIISVIFGRTFGNFDIEKWMTIAKKLASLGSIFIDYYSIDTFQDEVTFCNRVQTIASDSSSFFLHPLSRWQVNEKYKQIYVDTFECAAGLEACFYSDLQFDGKPLLLYKIVGFKSTKVIQVFNSYGLSVKNTMPIPNQLAPMSILEVNSN